MQIKYRIIAEYEFSAPSVFVSLFDTVELACDRVAEMYIDCKRVWVCPVYTDDNGQFLSVASCSGDICVAENGHGIGPLAP